MTFYGPDYGPWKFADLVDPSAEHLEAKALIEQFWKEFEDAAPEITRLLESSSGEAAIDLIQKLNPFELCFEYGRQDGWVLRFTTEGDYPQQPFLNAFVDAAPELDGWSFRSHRDADSGYSLQLVEARTGVKLNNPKLLGFPGENRFMDVVVLLDAKQVGPVSGSSAPLVLVETLLGEHDLDVWIGDIEVRQRPGIFAKFSNQPKGEDIRALSSMLAAHKQKIRYPETPWSEVDLEQLGWSLIEMRGPADAAEWDTLIAISTPAPEIVVAMLNDRFFSKRFSNRDELFARFIFADFMDTDQRAELEDEVNSRLRAGGAGSTLGGGTGVGSTQIFLAMEDVAESLNVLRTVVAERALPGPELRFADADLVGERLL